MSTTNNQLENVWVRIRGTQRQDGETEVSETVLCTQARFYRRKGVYYIIYEESEATGYGGCRTMLSFEPNIRLRMTRTGPVRSSLLLENWASAMSAVIFSKPGNCKSGYLRRRWTETSPMTAGNLSAPTGWTSTPCR